MWVIFVGFLVISCTAVYAYVEEALLLVIRWSGVLARIEGIRLKCRSALHIELVGPVVSQAVLAYLDSFYNLYCPVHLREVSCSSITISWPLLSVSQHTFRFTV
jgi:hypothetical protein